MSETQRQPEPQRLRVQVLLADRATTTGSGGTLNLLNAGWSATQHTGQMTPGHTVAVFFVVPFSRCNRDLSFTLELVDDDGHTVTPTGGPPLRVQQTMRFSPPLGAPNGTAGSGNFMVEVLPGLAIPGGHTYTWQASVDGESNPDWSVTYWVAPPPSLPFVGVPSPAADQDPSSS